MQLCFTGQQDIAKITIQVINVIVNKQVMYLVFQYVYLLQAVQGDLFDVAGAAADPAMDMWALGAIAFEVFTGRGLFSRKNYTDNDVVNMLLGFDNLPSESQPAFWHQIRDSAAQRLVQNLLRRVPDQRSTINEVCAAGCIT